MEWLPLCENSKCKTELGYKIDIILCMQENSKKTGFCEEDWDKKMTFFTVRFFNIDF